jgi:hypothetical protein
MKNFVSVCLIAASIALTRPVAACEREFPPPRLTPTNTLMIVWNAKGLCSETRGACVAGEVVNFSLITFGPDLSCASHIFRWDFGDGTTSSGVVPATTHSYLTSGAYLPSLVVTGSDTLQLDGSAHLILTRAVTLGAVIPLLSNAGLIFLAVAMMVSALSFLKR